MVTREKEFYSVYACINLKKCGSNTGMVIYQVIITPTGLIRYIIGLFSNAFHFFVAPQAAMNLLVLCDCSVLGIDYVNWCKYKSIDHSRKGKVG